MGNKIREILEHFINCCCMICTDPAIKIPQKSATDRTFSAILSLVRGEIEVEKKTIKLNKNHCQCKHPTIGQNGAQPGYEKLFCIRCGKPPREQLFYEDKIKNELLTDLHKKFGGSE